MGCVSLARLGCLVEGEDGMDEKGGEDGMAGKLLGVI